MHGSARNSTKPQIVWKLGSQHWQRADHAGQFGRACGAGTDLNLIGRDNTVTGNGSSQVNIIGANNTLTGVNEAVSVIGRDNTVSNTTQTSVIGSDDSSSSKSSNIERGLDKPEPPAMNSDGAAADLCTKNRP